MEANPFEFSPDQGGGNVVASLRRPERIVPIGVISIILASMGLLAVMGGIAGEVFNSAMGAQMVEAFEKSDDPALEAQAEMQRKSLDVQRRYRIPTRVLLFIGLVVCSLLLVSAAMVLRTSALGRRLFLFALIAVVVFDLGKTTLQLFIQSETMQVLGQNLPGLVAQDPEIDAEQVGQIESVMGGVMNGVFIAMVVFAIAWLTVKLVFYYLAYRYLNRPEVVAWFEPVQATVIPDQA